MVYVFLSKVILLIIFEGQVIMMESFVWFAI